MQSLVRSVVDGNDCSFFLVFCLVLLRLMGGCLAIVLTWYHGGWLARNADVWSQGGYVAEGEQRAEENQKTEKTR